MDNLIKEIEKQELADKPEMFKAFMYVYSALDNTEVISVDGKRYEENSGL